jgi:hypothetical protein
MDASRHGVERERRGRGGVNLIGLSGRKHFSAT